MYVILLCFFRGGGGMYIKEESLQTKYAMPIEPSPQHYGEQYMAPIYPSLFTSMKHILFLDIHASLHQVEDSKG